MTMLRPNWPSGLPSPRALQVATDALCGQYAWPETMVHPVVIGQAIELAFLLSAYDLVPGQQGARAAAFYLTLQTPRKSPRATGFRNQRRGASQHVLLDTASIR
jgi:hypothetical protein